MTRIPYAACGMFVHRRQFWLDIYVTQLIVWRIWLLNSIRIYGTNRLVWIVRYGKKSWIKFILKTQSNWLHWNSYCIFALQSYFFIVCVLSNFFHICNLNNVFFRVFNDSWHNSVLFIFLSLFSSVLLIILVASNRFRVVTSFDTGLKLNGSLKNNDNWLFILIIDFCLYLTKYTQGIFTVSEFRI